MINRRRFLQTGAAAAAMLALPRRAFPFAQSVKGVQKFIVPLPGLALSPSEPGIPVLTPNKMRVPGVDFYDIIAGQSPQAHSFHPAIPDTTIWAYGANTVTPDLRYLGGVIIAHRKTPVWLQVTNRLPADHLLPVDLTIVDPATGAVGREDRIAVHLHGGFVFWDSDGGPFAWYSNADPANGGFVRGPSFENGPTMGPGVGTATYKYPNDQSARTIWYHDHAYGLTRTNVYAGLASAYLITDDVEDQLIKEGVLPDPNLGGVTDGRYRLGIPLIVQDKTFWQGPDGDDPGYGNPGVVPQPPKEGSLWYPWEYEGFLDPPGDDGPSMLLTDVPTQTTTFRWGASPNGPFDIPSTVPEFFSDTIVVNGAAYPTLQVEPRRYRFRFINASQGRFYNLQLYVKDNSADGITLMPDPSGDVDPNGNPILLPQNLPGPGFIQIGNECGFLPKPAVFSVDDPTPGGALTGSTNKNSNLVMRYRSASEVLSRRADTGREVLRNGHLLRVTVAGDPTIGSAQSYNLLMSPAERPDVIIDFSDFKGTKLILYNDAPAPFPGGDIRNDYYNSGQPNDLTPIGGAPPTIEGFGPDTRLLMQFEVGTHSSLVGHEPNFAETVTQLAEKLPVAFQESQPNPADLVPTPENTHIKSLLESNDEFGRLQQFIGDEGAVPITLLQTPLTDSATQNQVQRWQIYNLTADTHPMHFHLVNVAVRSRQQWLFDSLGNFAFPLAPDPQFPVHEADLNEQGWKETVRMNPGEITTVDMQFTLPVATPNNPEPPDSPRLLAMDPPVHGAEYVWHCHILEHEEHDMMHTLVVMPTGGTPPAGRKRR